MPEWSSLVLVLIALLLMELVVEEKFHLRRRIVRRLGKRSWPGILILIFFSIAVVMVLDEVLIPNWPQLQNNDLYKYAKLAFIVYFLPKRGDRIGPDESNAVNG
jgi:hypothetical protein